MPATFKIQVDKLTPDFITDMKEKYGAAELEITVNKQPNNEAISEPEFWKTIDCLDFSKEKDSDILEPAIAYLSGLPIAHIYTFEDLLSEKLYNLDTRVIAENAGGNAYGNGNYFSVDIFLYARACVVANGENAYESVLATPKEMPGNLTFEPLLSLATKAYKRKTGKEFNYISTFNYETFSNKNGWLKK